jgi:hypothetical protein
MKKLPNSKTGDPLFGKQVSKNRNAGKSKLRSKRTRQSLDARMSKLTSEERTLKLIYGSYNPNDPAEQLAERARTLRLIAEKLGENARKSEAFQHSLRELERRATEPLFGDDAPFFRRLSKAMLRLRRGEPKGSSTTRKIRLILQHESKTGVVNLTQFQALLKKHWNISISLRQLRRLAPKYRAKPQSS